MDERQRRLWAGAEADAIKYGVIHLRHRDDADLRGREPRRFPGGTDERATEEHR